MEEECENSCFPHSLSIQVALLNGFAKEVKKIEWKSSVDDWSFLPVIIMICNYSGERERERIPK